MGIVSDRVASLALAREAFLTSSELATHEVREMILTSWRRSRFFGVAVDQVELPYRGDVDTDTRLVQAAKPVLDRLERELADARMTAILTDAQAWVVDRRAGERRCAPPGSLARSAARSAAAWRASTGWSRWQRAGLDTGPAAPLLAGPDGGPVPRATVAAARRRANAVIHTASNLNVELCRKTGEFFRTWGLPGSRFTPTPAPPLALTRGAEGGEQR